MIARLRAMTLSLPFLLSFAVSPATEPAPKPSEQQAGITTLTGEQARTLVADSRGLALRLDGLTTLPADVAQALGSFRGQLLKLDGVTTLGADAARPLAAFEGRHLSLGGLKTLAPDAARALAGFAGASLSLDGLSELPPEVAKALAEFKGDQLSLNGLSSLSADTAEALAAYKGNNLSLEGLTTLPDEAATALMGYKGQRLWLDGPSSLSVAGAKLVVHTTRSHGTGVRLSKLTALDTADAVEAATILAGIKGPLRLPNLKKLSPNTLTTLFAKTDTLLPEFETLELIAEADGSKSSFATKPADFNKAQKDRRKKLGF